MHALNPPTCIADVLNYKNWIPIQFSNCSNTVMSKVRKCTYKKKVRKWAKKIVSFSQLIKVETSVTPNKRR